VRQQIRVTRERLNQIALKPFCWKTNQYHTCSFGILHGMICHMCPCGIMWIKDELNLSLYSNDPSRWTPKGQMWQIVPCRIPKQHVWYWFLFFNKRVFGPVWLSGSRVTRIYCLISEKRIIRIRQNLVRSFVIDCFMGARDGLTNKTKRAKNWAKPGNISAIECCWATKNLISKQLPFTQINSIGSL